MRVKVPSFYPVQGNIMGRKVPMWQALLCIAFAVGIILYSVFFSYGEAHMPLIFATALVAVNKHACFYEVYEDICRCCGDPMLWTTYESSKEYENLGITVLPMCSFV